MVAIPLLHRSSGRYTDPDTFFRSFGEVAAQRVRRQVRAIAVEILLRSECFP